MKTFGHLLITIDGKKIIVMFLENGGTAAFSATCPHKGGPLEEGEFRKDRVICPWHSYEFDVLSGVPMKIPYPEKYGEWRRTGVLELYRTRINNKTVEIFLARQNDQVNGCLLNR